MHFHGQLSAPANAIFSSPFWIRPPSHSLSPSQTQKQRFMETLLGFGVLGMHVSELITSSSSPLSKRASPFHNLRRISRRSPRVSVSRSSLPGSELAGDDIMLMFLEERQLHGDFISRVSDIFWKRDVLNSGYVKPAVMEESIQPFEESKDEDLGGFLKLTKTQEWVSGNDVAPLNKKMDAKQWQNDRERTKRINLLKYEAKSM